MKLTVENPSGILVAEVDVDDGCPFASSPGEPPGFVLGRFVAGPGFSAIQMLLEEFRALYADGELDAAFAIHTSIDKLGLVATDSQGRRFTVFNVFFQNGGPLFAAVSASG